MKRIYLDYASLTPIDPRVIREVKKYSSPKYANPSSLYKEGVAAKKALEEGRKKVADFIHAHSDEIVFTSGGTEANGLALEGVARAAVHAGITKPHIIISSVEHSSIIEIANMMEKHGCEVTRLRVDVHGLISLDELKKSIKENTILVSVMLVNNEIGTIQPIKDIAKIIRQAKKHQQGVTLQDPARLRLAEMYPLFHTDAAQAGLCDEINIQQLGVDLLTLDAGKLYGPRSIGALYVKRGTPIEPLMYGGAQEKDIRAGTENIPSIMGFAKAVEIAGSNRNSTATCLRRQARYIQNRDLFITGLKGILPEIEVVGGYTPANQDSKSDQKVVTFVPHILNVNIPGIDNEFFVLQLDAKGVACSTKSSCLRDEEESYVLKAVGVDSNTSVRFSFGRWTKKGDIKKTLKIIKNILEKAKK